MIPEVGELTSDLVLEAVGEGVAEDEAMALLHRRRLPGHRHAARRQRVALRELWRRPRHCKGIGPSNRVKREAYTALDGLLGYLDSELDVCNHIFA